jgi:hypothetical protein
MVHVVDSRVKVFHNGVEVACHPEYEGRRKQILEIEHLRGIVGSSFYSKGSQNITSNGRMSSELLRPLREYEILVGGGW